MYPTLQLKPRTSKNSSLIFSKSNLQKNNSMNQQNNKSFLQTKSSPKTNDKKKPSQLSYIAKALANIENGCLDQKTGQIKIDGSIGDYKMKIFRKKDKLKYYNDPSSIFTDKEFIQQIFDCANCTPDKNQQAQKQASSPTSELSSPKRLNRQQRARPGLKKQGSILSPGLRDTEQQKSQTKKYLSNQQNFEMMTKINDILSKPRDVYLYKPVQNVEEEEEKNKLRKGVEQELRQKQGHLFYRSIPQYMAEKWFKTIDNSTLDGNYVAPYVEMEAVSPPRKENRHKRTHIFRSLQQNCRFNMGKNYNSMISY